MSEQGEIALARFLSFLGIRRGEAMTALGVSAYLFLIIGSYLLLKAVRTALFIDQYGAVKLPWVMLGIAVLAGIFASFYIRLARRYETRQLTLASLLLFALIVLVFWWLARDERPWLFPVIYVWSGLYGVVAPTQVWTLANELFTTREAKRLFGIVGAGGILGAVASGSLAYRLAPLIGTTNLLLVLVAYLLLAAALVWAICRHRAPRARAADHPSPQGLRESLGRIHASKHLRLLGALVFITAVATSSADLQFNLVVERYFLGDELTSYLGLIYALISVGSFVVQVLLTGRFLRHLGAGLSLLILPLMLMAGSGALLALGALWAAVLMKASDGTLKHSLDRSSRELMYLPVPPSIKPHAKSTIDTVMDRLGDGTAGIVLLVLTSVLGLGLQAMLWVNIAVIGGWIWIAVQLRRQYLTELRDAMGSGAPRGASGEAVEPDADTLELLRQLLHSGSESQKLAALQWLTAKPDLADEATLVALVRSDASAAVRRAALMLLLGRRETDLPGELLDRLQGEGHRVMVQAIDLLTGPPGEETTRHLEALLGRAGEVDRLPLLAFVFRQLGEEFEPFARRCFDALLRPQAPPEARKAAARTLGLLPASSSLQALLDGLLRDHDPEVCAAAAESAGALGRIDLVESMTALLERPRASAGARRGLLALGDRGVAALCDSLTDPQRPEAIRAAIADVLAEIDSSAGVTALVEAVEHGSPAVRDRATTALLRLRRRRNDWHPLRGGRLASTILAACREHDRLRRLGEELAAGEVAGDSTTAFLSELMASKGRRSSRRIFELLALEYPLEDIRRAGWAMQHGSEVDRANAIEFLDNLLPGPLKRRLIPLIEGAPRRAGRRRPRSSVLVELATDADPWVAACALRVARLGRVSELESHARQARASAHRPLRQEAQAWFPGEAGESR